MVKVNNVNKTTFKDIAKTNYSISEKDPKLDQRTKIISPWLDSKTSKSFYLSFSGKSEKRANIEKLLNQLFEAKQIDSDEPRFSEKEVLEIVYVLAEEKMAEKSKILQSILDAKTADGKAYRFENEKTIFDPDAPIQIVSDPECISYRTPYMKFGGPLNNISSILRVYDPKKTQNFDLLMSDPRFTSETFAYLLDKLNNPIMNNEALQLVEDERKFPEEVIKSTLGLYPQSGLSLRYDPRINGHAEASLEDFIQEACYISNYEYKKQN